MTDKTAIDALKKICSIETGTWDNPVPFSKLYHEAKGIATEALAAIEAEKPDEHDIETLVESICEPGSELWSGETSDLDGEWEIYPDNEAIGEAIKSYAESYHAEHCKACDWNKNCDNCGWTETRTGYGCQNHEVTECLPGKRKGWKQNV